MGQNSNIQWTDHTFNPWIGCTKIGLGCKFCYAEAQQDHRLQRVQWGPSGQRIRTSKRCWDQVKRWNELAKAEGVRRRVFCASLADIFEDRAELVPWRSEFLELVDCCRGLDFQLLTKRGDQIERLITQATGRSAWAWLQDNHHVWIGHSASTADEVAVAVKSLEPLAARVRFLSVEPLLEKVRLDLEQTNWVIVGGESGPKARECNIDWIRSVVKQCRAAGVPVFVKQLGARPIANEMETTISRNRVAGIQFTGNGHGEYYWHLKCKKGGDMDQWPLDLRIREFPQVEAI